MRTVQIVQGKHQGLKKKEIHSRYYKQLQSSRNRNRTDAIPKQLVLAVQCMKIEEIVEKSEINSGSQG